MWWTEVPSRSIPPTHCHGIWIIRSRSFVFEFLPPMFGWHQQEQQQQQQHQQWWNDNEAILISFACNHFTWNEIFLQPKEKWCRRSPSEVSNRMGWMNDGAETRVCVFVRCLIILNGWMEQKKEIINEKETFYVPHFERSLAGSFISIHSMPFTDGTELSANSPFHMAHTMDMSCHHTPSSIHIRRYINKITNANHRKWQS